MSIFKKKSTDIVKDILSENNEQQKLLDRPRICCIDLKEQDLEALRVEKYNLFKGTLGSTMQIPNTSTRDSHFILLDHVLPSNFHEYDILILDLTNEQSKEFVPKEHLTRETRMNKILQLTCSYPTTIFDPRPISSFFISEHISKIHSRKFLEIIFACGDYEIEYEKVQITDGYSERLNNEKFGIYNFNLRIPLQEPKVGKEVIVCKSKDDIVSLLNKHTKNIVYEQTFNHPKVWNYEDGNYYLDTNFVPLLININKEIVSFYQVEQDLVSFVFPNIQNKAEFLAEFLKNVCPTFLPELFPYSTQFKWKELPEYYLPEHLDLLNKKAKFENEYKIKLKEIDNIVSENLTKYKFLHDLITETGDKLVHAVHDFLSWLEFEEVKIKDEFSENILEEDIQVKHDDGLLIIETKGIGGTSTDNDCSQISKIKLRRCKERKSFDVYALYIVNHQRYQPPLLRVNPPFTSYQIEDAINDERGLVTTWQLFKLFFDITNNLIAKSDAKKNLIEFGLVEFKPKISKPLGTPKEILKDGFVVILDIVDICLSVGQTLIIEKDNRYRKLKIHSIQVGGQSVSKIDNGEVGLKLDGKVSKGSVLSVSQP